MKLPWSTCRPESVATSNQIRFLQHWTARTFKTTFCCSQNVFSNLFCLMDSARVGFLVWWLCCHVDHLFPHPCTSTVLNWVLQHSLKTSISVEKLNLSRRCKPICFTEKFKQNNADPCLNNSGLRSKPLNTQIQHYCLSLQFILRMIECKTCIGLSCLFLYRCLWD